MTESENNKSNESNPKKSGTNEEKPNKDIKPPDFEIKKYTETGKKIIFNNDINDNQNG